MKKIFNKLGIYLLFYGASIGVLAQLGVQVQELETIEDTDKFTVITKMNLSLNQSLEDALLGGTTVGFSYELEILEDGWIYDSSLAEYEWHAYIKLGKYGQGFEYRRFGSNDWIRSDKLQEALLGMQTLEIEFSIPKELEILRQDTTYFIHRVEVDIDELPTPLKVDLLTSANWNFSSGWQRHNK